MVCHHLIKFGGDRYRSKVVKDIKIPVCHVIKQDHVVKRPGDYNDRNFSR